MIRPLRQRHRAVVCTLGVLLPVAFAAGLAARKPVPVAATVPSELIGQTSGLGPVVWVRSDLWTDRRVLTTLRRAAAGARAGEFTFRELARPDVLVYWVTGPGAIAGGLPENARLLGVLSSGVPLPIPAAARSETGRFGLYSLADHEVVAVSNSSTVPQD